jgi:pyruvate/2-oxoglutarate dehydrogenase complex dihydrolipoamide acyltransferase (E2) component
VGAIVLGGHSLTPSRSGYVLSRVPNERQPVLDRLAGASRRPQVHALVELDVTEPRAWIGRAEPRVSWTGFIVASVARAVAMHPEVNTRKAGNHVLSFQRVDVGATVERHWEGRTVLDAMVLPEADRTSPAEITEALQLAKFGPPQHHHLPPVTRLVVRLPGPMRRAAIRHLGRRPGVAATFGPAVAVTSIGMFSGGWGWAIPLSPLTLVVTVGGVVDRAVVREGQVVVRPMLPLTLTFDHALVDGAPAARFTESLRSLIETAAAFEESSDTATT